jgi:hypothetical protein
MNMRRITWALPTLAAALLGAGARAATTAGPPPGLTSNGRVLWNLDAVLNDTFGNRVECWDNQREVIFSVPHGSYCPAPAARYQPWEFTFLKAFHSEFRLVRLASQPDTGATSTPVHIGSRYISCPGGAYHHGGRGWIVIGGGAGPTGLFWCN